MMIALGWAAAVGAVAALCTTLAFLPQLFTMKGRKNAELSSAMLVIYLAGLTLWLAYGVMIAAVPVIAANVASIVIVSAVTFRKLTTSRAIRRAPRRLRIAIDMDEVMADALSEHVTRYNRAFGARLSHTDLCGRHLEDCVPPERRAAVEAMLDSSFFADLPVIEDCRDVVCELAARHDVFVVTAAMDVPCSFDAKFQWLRRHFPFISPAQIVFCGDKSIVDADYLIDDRARHFEHFKGRPLLFSAPHNAAEARYPRVESWRDVRELFATLDADATNGTHEAAGLGDEAATAA